MNRGACFHGTLHGRALPAVSQPASKHSAPLATPTQGHWEAPGASRGVMPAPALHGVLHSAVLSAWRTERAP